MDIDWSKAPEGANGYVDDDDAGPAIWYRRNGEEIHWAHVNGLAPLHWHKSTGIRANIIWRDEQPAAWSGEGLPPVGTVCEGQSNSGVWRECKVVHHSLAEPGILSGVLVVFGENYAGCGWWKAFRPLRTPEQIAAEERDRAIFAMLDEFPGLAVMNARKIYDAGYRKVEGGAA